MTLFAHSHVFDNISATLYERLAACIGARTRGTSLLDLTVSREKTDGKPHEQDQ
jgi:hypothetical protein